ncbi:MAG: GNAT family N-acetyltransferase [Flavobacteriia bacterium]|nr:GNAT family N-acetyltransferase [Flavobacteriia bacterium]
MNFNHDYFLENEIVLLRPLEKIDFNNLIEYSQNEPEIWKYSSLQADGEEKLTSYISHALDDRKAGKCYPFIVYDKINQKYVGSTRFYDIQEQNMCATLGFTWYGKIAQGTKVNKNCKYLLLEFAFEQMNWERIEFRADINNSRSIAAMKSIGCTKEGILRSNSIRPDGTRRDSIVLSILKNEWFDSIQKMLVQKMNIVEKQANFISK